MDARDAYATVEELLFELGYTDSDSDKFDGCLLEAIDKLDVVTENYKKAEEIFSS